MGFAERAVAALSGISISVMLPTLGLVSGLFSLLVLLAVGLPYLLAMYR